LPFRTADPAAILFKHPASHLALMLHTIQRKDGVADKLSKKKDNFMNAAKKSILLTVGLLLFAVEMFTQRASTDIFGVVQTKDGSPAPGVTITATSLSLADKAMAVSDADGAYRMLNLPHGIYKLTFVLEGFKTVVRKNVFLGQEQTVNLKIILKPKHSEESVTIVDPAALIIFTSATGGMTMARKMFQTLPRGRNFDSLANIVPGVSSEVLLLGGTSIDGASGLENIYTIDGADTTSIKDGSSGQNVSFNFVDEVQVKATGFTAEFAGSLGGVINVVTRSGGNEFHGEVIGYYSGAPPAHKVPGYSVS
jgi:hypothetical protein